MIFNFSEEADARRIRKEMARRQWHRWYAWRPTLIDRSYQLTWLEWIERRWVPEIIRYDSKGYRNHVSGGYWEYRWTPEIKLENGSRVVIPADRFRIRDQGRGEYGLRPGSRLLGCGDGVTGD